VSYTIPSDTHLVGDTGHTTDHNNAIDVLKGMGAVYNVLNTAFAGGAKGDNVTDDTAAIQAAIDAAAAAVGGSAPAGGVVYLPPGKYRVSQLTMRAGTILRGASSGSYPDNNAIPGVSVLERIASTNLDLIAIPDGVNFCRIFDLAIDGNKNNNTSGDGLHLADGAAGQESQIIIERCYFHDSPGSNLYLGHNRRANKVISGVFNYAGVDGITTSGSDNIIRNCIIGSNARAGICLGTTITQNWAASGSPFAAAVEHVVDNDIYGNAVGIALAQSTSDCMVFGNGIDRNTKQGLTVYDGTSNVIECNSFHSNGTLANNTYAHIDVGANVAAVGIHGNNFGPLDAGVTNNASFCVNYGGATGGIIGGNIGIADATASAGGLINSVPNATSYVMASKAGAIIQGSGNDVLDVRNSSGSLLTKITNGGSFVHSGGAAQYTNAQNVFGSSTALATTVASFVGTATGTRQIATQLFSGQTADIATFFASNGSTVLAKINSAGVYIGPQAATVSYKPSNPTATTSLSVVCMGIGSTCTYTPLATGKVLVTVCGSWLTATATVQGGIGARYGTGTAPANGAADTGTAWGTNAATENIRAAGTGGGLPFAFTELLSLTANTAYWFDLVTGTTNAADAATITNIVMTLQELPA